MRDVQLLFAPYDLNQLITILEEKIFSNFPKIKNLQLNDIFLSLVDDKALEIISRKVAKMNGDVRVAFDLMKSCLTKLWTTVKNEMHPLLVNEQQIKVTMDIANEVIEEKYGSKLHEILRALPRQDIIVLEAMGNLFDDLGEEKQLSYAHIFDEVDRECKSRGLKKLDIKEILNSMEELEYYSIIHIDKNKKEVKNSKFSLKVELSELIKELDKLSNPTAQ